MLWTSGGRRTTDERIPRSAILDLVRQNFDLRPAALRDHLHLLRPIYRPTAAYGHFGRTEPTFTWEATDVADHLREQAGLAARSLSRRRSAGHRALWTGEHTAGC